VSLDAQRTPPPRLSSMAAKDPSFSPQGVSPQDLRAERASFNGSLLAALAYGGSSLQSRVFSARTLVLLTRFWQGALMMLYLQLIQVLLNKPKRGRTFCATVAYSGVLFPLATLAIAGMFKFEELSFIDNRDFPGGPSAFSRVYVSDVFNVLSQSWSVMITSCTLRILNHINDLAVTPFFHGSPIY
jgi:hypothetical protein